MGVSCCIGVSGILRGFLCSLPSTLGPRIMFCCPLPAPTHSRCLEALEGWIKRHKTEAGYDFLWEKFLSLVIRSIDLFLMLGFFDGS